MSNMFSDCEKLKIFQINKNNIFFSKKLKNINNIFRNCKSIKTIDLSSLAIQNVSEKENVFDGCDEKICIEVNQNSFEEFNKIFPDMEGKFMVLYNNDNNPVSY